MVDLTFILAQAGKPPEAAGGSSLRDIFLQSFDTFSVLLILGSLLAGTVIVRCALEVRKGNIIPEDSEKALRRLVESGNIEGARGFVERDDSFPSKVLLAAMKAPASAPAIREAAELTASEESARWFRKIEPLNVVGNLGPLLGLAGTVWGMVKAFMALNTMGGQATAGSLSEGISKALFHTLLGLMLAIPALAVFGFFRMVVDKHCTRAMVVSAELTEQYIKLMSTPKEPAANAAAAAARAAMAGAGAGAVRH
ncbi:MAG: MotA/TolQ/ExbB proton channel family protein [Phycisphaerales bacterium]